MKSNRIYKNIDWIFKYLEHKDEEINTLNFIDFFRYNKSEEFINIVDIKQRTLKSYTPYKNEGYISQSCVINKYLGSLDVSNSNEYDKYLLGEYNKIIKNLEIPENIGDIELVHLYTSRLCIIKAYIIYLRLKDENKYVPELFEAKETLQDLIDTIKINSLSLFFNNIKSCVEQNIIYNLQSFYPLIRLQSVNICKK